MKPNYWRVLPIALSSFTRLRSRPAYSYSELPIANACLAPVLALEVAGRIAPPVTRPVIRVVNLPADSRSVVCESSGSHNQLV